MRQVRWLGLMALWNVGGVALVCVTLWLQQRGILFLGYVIGPVVYFVPGLLLALCIEQLTNRRSSMPTLLLWTAIISLAVIPGLVYLVDRFVFDGIGVLALLPAFALVWATLFIALMLLTAFYEVVSGVQRIRLTRKEIQEIGSIVAGFLVVLVLNHWLYPFIPEADGYGYLIKLRDAASQPGLLVNESRVLFLTLVSLLSSLTGMSQYLVVKVGLPLLFLSVVATVYLIIRPLTQSSPLRVLTALAPLAFPVLLQEMLIGRPQTIVIVALVPAMYLVARLSSEPLHRQLYWCLLLIGAGILGLQIHTLAILLSFLGAIGVVRIAWPLFRARPIDGLVMAGLFLVLLLPWLQSIRIFSDILHIVRLMGEAISQGKVTIWFIDHYRNVDGTEVGWPGWSWVLYYGYNLGLLFPVVLLGHLVLRQRAGLIRMLRAEWPVFLLGSGMVLIAELLPRFGLAYLPDRAWLFVALCLSLVVPYLIARFFHRSTGWLALVLICSIASGLYVTYAKQGWVTRAEYVSVAYMQAETPATAVFLAQGGSRPAVRYFANRTLIRPPSEVFLDHDGQAVEDYLVGQQVAYETAVNRLHSDQAALGQSFQELGVQVSELRDQGQMSVVRSRATQLVTELESAAYDETLLRESYVLEGQPVYIMYDRTKFDSLYGQRSWWRTSNFYEADTDKFSKLYPLVYDRDGVKIWKVR
ncbi:MAG: hypothetical protein AAB701_00755 [Patescibacteria group bacterium]